MTGRPKDEPAAGPGGQEAAQAASRSVPAANRPGAAAASPAETAAPGRADRAVAGRGAAELLAQVCHEMRAPAASALGMARQLLESELGPVQRDQAQSILRSAEALLGIIDDLVDHTRIETGQLELEWIAFDLRVLLQGISGQMQPRAADRGLELSIATSLDVPSRLVGDPGRLRQVLVSLVGGAIRFAEEGTVGLEVRLARESSTHVVIRFEVQDPSSRLREWLQASSSRLDSTGLNLSVVAHLVERMGGALGSEAAGPGDAADGTGLWFTVALEKQREVVAAESPGDIRGQRVLVLCDDPTDRASLVEQLRAWGCRHHETNSNEALLSELRAAVAGRDPFTVALLDVAAPPEEVEQLGRAVVDDPSIRGTDLVLIANAARRGDAARMQAAGFSAYLTKPLGSPQLHDCLATLAGRRAAAAQGNEHGPMITRHSIAEQRKHAARILFVGDRAQERQATHSVLERLGYRATAVPDAAEALVLLSREPYDLVLVGTDLPDMSNLEAIRLIRDRGSAVVSHEVPVVAVTAEATAGEDQGCLDAGANACVPRPIEPDKLRAAIEGLLPTAALAASAAQDLSAGLLDRQALLARLGGDEELSREVLAAFLESTPELIGVLQQAAAEGDTAGLQRHGKTLKDASANVSAVALSSVAHRIAIAAQEGKLEEAKVLVERLEQEFQRLDTYLVRSASKGT